MMSRIKDSVWKLKIRRKIITVLLESTGRAACGDRIPSGPRLGTTKDFFKLRSSSFNGTPAGPDPIYRPLTARKPGRHLTRNR
jgi:hypothetical protein